MHNTIINTRNIDLSASPLLGEGQCSQVFEYGDDCVVKLFYDNLPQEAIRHEYNTMRTCFENGLAAVNCYELVSYQGRIGILMQKVSGISLEQAVLEHPEKLPFFAEKMALNLASIHAKHSSGASMPAADRFYADCIDKCLSGHWITEEEHRKLHALVEAIPTQNGMIHGDYHVLNMMIEQDEIRMIDLADVQLGHPIYDLLIANIYLHFMPLNMTDLYRTLIKLAPEDSCRMWDIFLKTYFRTDDEARLDRIKELLDQYSLVKIMLAPFSFSNLPEGQAGELVNMARTSLMPVIDSMIGRIPDSILALEL
ncbi:MAG: phosphotransferase [Lachnospiraceae bacterium]|nr:phosphotransferase [Lachnospiraceae bacterium]